MRGIQYTVGMVAVLLLTGCVGDLRRDVPRGIIGMYKPPEVEVVRYDDEGSGLDAVVELRGGEGWRWVEPGESFVTLRRVGLEAARDEAQAAIRASQERLVAAEVMTEASAQDRGMEAERLEAARAAAESEATAWVRGARSDAIRESALAVRALALAGDRLEVQYAAMPTVQKLTDPQDPDSPPTKEARLIREAWSIVQAQADIEGHRHERRLRDQIPRHGESLQRALREADARLSAVRDRHAVGERRDTAALAEARRHLDEARARVRQLNTIEPTVSYKVDDQPRLVRVSGASGQPVKPDEVIAGSRHPGSGTVIVTLPGDQSPRIRAETKAAVVWPTLGNAITRGIVSEVRLIQNPDTMTLLRLQAPAPTATLPPEVATPVRVELDPR